jgi:hypothetical protein
MKKYRMPLWLVMLALLSLTCGLFQTRLPEEQPLHTNTLVSPTETAETQPELAFDISTAQQDLPAEILKEVDYFGGGGPGDIYCPNLLFDIPYEQPTITIDPIDSELLELGLMAVCGLQEQQSLATTITFPDGRIINQSLTSQLLEVQQSKAYYAVLKFKPLWDDPVGLYTFTMQGDNFTFQSNAYFYPPIGPHLRRLNEDHLFLYGFTPNENVTLFYYASQRSDGTLQLMGWQDYLISNDGTLMIKVPYAKLPESPGDLAEEDYIVIGSSSGEHHMLLDDLTGGSFIWNGLSIQGEDKFLDPPDPFSTRLACPQDTLDKYQDFASEVIVDYPNGLSHFANPRVDARLIQTIPNGEKIFAYGPYCSEGYVWWSVYFGENSGYIIGSDKEQDFLKPLK